MKTLVLTENDANQRLDRFLSKRLPHLPPSLLARLIRKKYCKINGKRVSDGAIRLNAGDTLELYFSDTLLTPPPAQEAFRLLDGNLQGIVFEDDNLIIVDKRPGLVVHDDSTGSPDTLINRIQAYLYKKKAWDPEAENAFAPALCNRIDRNTGGLVIAAKNATALREMNEIIRLRLVSKRYLCLTHGRPTPEKGTVRSYLKKDEAQNRVFVSDKPIPEGKTAVTHYKTLGRSGAFWLVECELETGRTHQIRAQMAHIGAPLAGDTKYGRSDGVAGGQALYAYGLTFAESLPCAKALSYLAGQTVELEQVILDGKPLWVRGKSEKNPD